LKLWKNEIELISNIFDGLFFQKQGGKLPLPAAERPHLPQLAPK